MMKEACGGGLFIFISNSLFDNEILSISYSIGFLDFCTLSNNFSPVERHASGYLCHHLAGQLSYSHVLPDKPYSQGRRTAATRLLLLQLTWSLHICPASAYLYGSKYVGVLPNLVNHKATRRMVLYHYHLHR